MQTLSRDPEVVLKKLPGHTCTHSHSQRNSLEPDTRKLVHHYLEGKLGVEVHCRSRNEIADFESCDLALALENLAADKITVFNSHSDWTSDHQIAAAQRRANQVEPSVAIDPSPVVQGNECRSNIELLPIESAGQSRVTLYSLNNGGYIRRNIFHSPNRLFEVRGVRGDRKLLLLCIGGRVASEFQNGGIMNAGIQSAPELIQHLSEFEREGESPVPFDWLNKEPPSPIVVYLSPRGINLICVESVPTVYEGLAVHLCPINTAPTRLEW
jgi:hypothetical protein